MSFPPPLPPGNDPNTQGLAPPPGCVTTTTTTTLPPTTTTTTPPPTTTTLPPPPPTTTTTTTPPGPDPYVYFYCIGVYPGDPTCSGSPVTTYISIPINPPQLPDGTCFDDAVYTGIDHFIKKCIDGDFACFPVLGDPC